jgi:DNA repair protein RecO (recombination protein O)
MLTRSRGILLHSIRYSEKSMILKILTEHNGLQSYFLHSVSGRKNKSQGALQPLNLLEVVSWKEPSADLETIREIRVEQPYRNIGIDFLRNTVILFLNEVLYKVIRESGPQPELYHFLRANLLHLDLEPFEPVTHLYFLAGLTIPLGITPDDNYNQSMVCFDMQEGSFKTQMPTHPNIITDHLVQPFYLLFHAGEGQKHLVTQHRRELLPLLLEYYRLHIEGFQGIKSLEVIRELMK